jgi:drug/metabolite transporter (DMT)-like permease
MSFQYHLLLPFLAGWVYAAAALCLKPVIEGGMGPWRISAMTTWAVALGLGTMALALGPVGFPEVLWPGMVSGLLFVAANTLTMLAITRGDVSVATPVMGVKVVAVAVFLRLFTGEDPGWRTWLAAGLTLGGIVLLNTAPGGRHRRVGFTVGCALASATLFAAVDVLTQVWAGRQGFGPFTLTMSVTAALGALALVPKFSAPLSRIPRGLGKYLWLGVAGTGLQAMGIVAGTGIYGDAAGSNIVYSGRGIWSVVLVWLAGHWFRNEERGAGHGTMAGRLAGALLVVAAIALVMV